MTVIMFSGCSTTVQNLAIGEEKTLETGKTEQESVTEKDINMNEKESFNAESNIKNVIHTGHLSAWRWLSVLSWQRNYGMAVQSVRTRINRKVKTEKLIETSQRNLSVL